MTEQARQTASHAARTALRRTAAGMGAMHLLVGLVHLPTLPPYPPPRSGRVEAIWIYSESWPWSATHLAVAVLLLAAARTGRSVSLAVTAHTTGSAVTAAYATGLLTGPLLTNPAWVSPSGLLVAGLTGLHMLATSSWRVVGDDPDGTGW